MSYCALINGISPKMCMLCVRVKINKRSFEPFLCVFELAKRSISTYIQSCLWGSNVVKETQQKEGGENPKEIYFV